MLAILIESTVIKMLVLTYLSVYGFALVSTAVWCALHMVFGNIIPR
jgi:hypothetical protein